MCSAASLNKMVPKQIADISEDTEVEKLTFFTHTHSLVLNATLFTITPLLKNNFNITDGTSAGVH
jgi:hypothetical protein